MAFTRTLGGQIAKYRLHSEPLIWVEGSVDVPFYQELLKGIPCRIEYAGGKEECKKLAQLMVRGNHPFVVALDGDYEILTRKRNPHRHVIILQRYAIENYLFEKNAFESTCCKYAPAIRDDIGIGNKFEATSTHLEKTLKELIVLDLAHNLAKTGEQIIKTPHELISSKGRVEFSADKIINVINNGNSVDIKYIKQATSLIDEYTQTHRLVDLVKGHFLFEVIRMMVKEVIKRTPSIDNTGLMMILSAEIWSTPPTRDHIALKNRLRKAVREVARQRGQVSGLVVVNDNLDTVGQ